MFKYLVLICLMGALTGCGQSGALYLPEQPNKTITSDPNIPPNNQPL